MNPSDPGTSTHSSCRPALCSETCQCASRSRQSHGCVSWSWTHEVNDPAAPTLSRMDEKEEEEEVEEKEGETEKRV